MRINGLNIANKIFENLKTKTAKLKKKNIIPNLAIILIGNDPASSAYVKQKEIKAKSIGAKVTTFNLKPNTSQDKIEKLINKLNSDKLTHGIIVQQPLPSHIYVEKITNLIHPQKDVDGFHKNTKFEMPISLAILEILKHMKIQLPTPGVGSQIKTLVIGKGETGGKPAIQVLKKIGFDPIIIDSKTKNPASIIKKADLIITAVGKPEIIKKEMLKKGVKLISIGIHKDQDNKLHGDYKEEEIKNTASFYTPTPGGSGPINVAMLLKNLMFATQSSVTDN
jgi:methylenetetrahydrofolate dehydrogenase (NADP+) / methenyltetrahydrofolate cyclohydrolase